MSGRPIKITNGELNYFVKAHKELGVENWEEGDDCILNTTQSNRDPSDVLTGTFPMVCDFSECGTSDERNDEIIQYLLNVCAAIPYLVDEIKRYRKQEREKRKNDRPHKAD